MGVEKNIVIQGKCYTSLLEAADEFGVHKSTLARRLRDGWTPEQAVGLAEKPKRIGSGKKVIYKGQMYNSIKHLAETHGIHPATFKRKLLQGSTAQQVIEAKDAKRNSPAAKTISYKGMTYPSITSLTNAHDVNASQFVRRLQRGWNMEQALGYEPAPPRFRNFEGHARNTKWKNERTTATGVEPIPDAEGYKLYLIRNTKSPKQYVGITIGTLDKRLKQHFSSAKRGRKGALQNAINHYGEDCFSIELISNSASSFEELQDLEILEIAKRDCIRNGYNSAHGGSLGTSKSITVQGISFPSYAQAAEYYGVDATVFSLRIARLKWTPEQAAGLDDKHWKAKSKNFFVNGKTYSSIRQAAIEFNKNIKLVYSRIEKGWTPEQALGIHTPPESVKFTGKEIIVQGKTYKSIAAAAAELGIAAEPFRLRMLNGMTPEQALSKARKKV
jgi:hypothetical protein